MKMYFDNPFGNTWKRPQNKVWHWMFSLINNEFVFFVRVFGLTLVKYRR